MKPTLLAEREPEGIIAKFSLHICGGGMRPKHEPEQITELSRLRAFMNPLRMQLYRLLYAAGTATASQLAEHVDGTPSLVSYHLRKLAEHGFVTRRAGRGLTAASGGGRWRLRRAGASVTRTLRTRPRGPLQSAR
ncbi:hypothetical protein GCM10010339_86060 [Streptomyces alanosinicus]|uniref:HTH arsR-type domain-containing protein n=1 Tax=Streptomyces alanosinicus TaxID=68171 RepID=A0A919D6K0_9ACTN|nr:hypothetical protein GCM10010339_86060 [Streptomyces alanosinicus]